MRHGRLLVIGLGIVAAAGCGSSSFNTTTPSYQVEYSVATVGFVTIDSVKYDNGAGALVSLIHPNPGSLVTLTPNSPVSIQATAWVSMPASTTVIFKESWTAKGVFGADSLVATAGASPTTQVLALPHHTVS